MREKILDLVTEYCNEKLKPKPFNVGSDKVGVGWPCYSDEELREAIGTILDLRLSQGPKVKKFEKLFSNYIGTKHGVACNSGSSANLLALSVLIKSGKVKAGSKVIIPATTFATVAMPILQLGLVPKLVDVDLDTYNINLEELEGSIDNNTGLIMTVPTLACPINMERVMEIANKHNFPVLEDCCEAHGASWNGRKMGSYGTLSCFSFFVAHNITTGEGGMVLTDDDELLDLLQSTREFGRLKQYDKDKPRFYYTNGDLKDFDERYAFEEVGYNLRMTDINASFGIPQVKKLDKLNQQRIEIANFYTSRLSKWDNYIKLPYTDKLGVHTYYGYIITIREGWSHKFNRKTLVNYLENNGVETRAVMGGNLSRQTFMIGQNFEVYGNLKNANYITDNSFFIGSHPHIDKYARKHVTDLFDNFFMELDK